MDYRYTPPQHLKNGHLLLKPTDFRMMMALVQW